MTQATVYLKDLAYRKFLWVAPDTSLSEVTRQLDDKALEKAVIMQGASLAGIFSARDRLKAQQLQLAPELPVRELVSSEFCTLHQDTSIDSACTQLLQQAHASLVIIDDNAKPLGWLNEADLLQQKPYSPEVEQPSCTHARGARSFPIDNDTWSKAGVTRNTTGRRQADKQLRTLKQQTDLLSRFAAALINLPGNDSNAVVNHALKEMGELAQVDRAYIFRYDFEAGTTCNTHEWCASGISSQIDNLHSVPLDSLTDWTKPHKRAESLVVDDVDALPAGTLRDILGSQDIKSIVSLPILGSDGCIGFLGFDSVRSKRRYGQEELEVLGLFARILANYRERLTTEQKLANSEANFHAFFDKTQDLLFVLSHQGTIVQCNTQATQRLGYSENELCGQSVLHLHPEENKDELARIMEALSKGNIDNYTIPMQAKSGQRVPIESSVVSGQWNGVPALFLACRDLTEITASEEKFSRAFHLTPMPMTITELTTGKFLEVNEAFLQITGYTLPETIGNTSLAIGIFVEPEMRDLIVEQLREKGVINSFECPFRTKTGGTVHGLFNAVLLELQGIEVMISQLVDVTALKATEEALANEKLHLHTLINSQSNLVWLKDPDGVYLACNAPFESLFGHPEAMIQGKTDFDFVDQECARRFRRNDRLAVETGEPRINEETLVFASNNYSGLFETTKTPIFNNNRLIGVLGVARDITEARQAEQERLRTERELHQAHKMEALGQLTGGVAHEFNNMLAIILGYKDLLQARLGPDIDPSMNTWLDHIDVAGVGARELVRQLLSFSRPKEKQPQRINLKTGVRKAIALSQSSLPSSIHINYQPDSDLPDVLLDIGELQQMLTNLLLNARDAMDGQGRIEVTLKHARLKQQECQLCHTLVDGNWVELSIADNGPGLHPEQFPRIFEPFYTTKEVGKGTGLGLSLVRSIMEHNGGHILIDSQPGPGIRFRLLFPPLEYEILPFPPKHQTIVTPALKAGKVMVVDDEPALTEFLQEALELQGLQVVAFNDSREALAHLLDSDQTFDLLITDQTMPGMLGTELVLLAKQYQSDLKVILCTGHSEQINADNAEELGIDRFLEKPLGIQNIVIAIDELSE